MAGKSPHRAKTPEIRWLTWEALRTRLYRTFEIGDLETNFIAEFSEYLGHPPTPGEIREFKEYFKNTCLDYLNARLGREQKRVKPRPKAGKMFGKGKTSV
jgi:hypothetical protein